MPLIETKGAASAQGFGEFAASSAGAVNYIENVFSTYLYTGNGSTQTITNGIDLSTKGGLVWIKQRSTARNNYLFDTVRGATEPYLSLSSNLTDSQTTNTGGFTDTLTAFNTTGFSLGSRDRVNNSGSTYASWTFRKQPKFFDVVTYTGNGTAGRTVAHNLGSVPGCIIVKDTSTSALWAVYHRSLTSASYYMELNTTVGQAANSGYWNGTAPTSSVFTLGNDGDVNGSGRTYVAYLFAHNAGGFGLTGTDNVISCGTFTGNSAGDPVAVNLGYEAQWVMHKRTNGTGNWAIFDSMRGAPTDQPSQDLLANSSAAEVAGYKGGYPTSTGFVAYPEGTGSPNTYIYIAIRRGPMKVPTDPTKVFWTGLGNGSSTVPAFVTGFPVDGGINRLAYTGTSNNFTSARLTGDQYMITNATNAAVADFDFVYGSNTGYIEGAYGGGSGYTQATAWAFQRAPSFFDVVCYTGNSVSGRQVTHNLGVAPELFIVKNRTTAGENWEVYSAALGNTKSLLLNTTAAFDTKDVWNNTSPTSTYIVVGATGYFGSVNQSGSNYVAYLFATCAGVSKVGSYTGTGATQTISCGFTGGARFVLIKRTDTTGDWYYWDTVRGMVSGTDPSLRLNSTAAQVNANSVYTATTGFQIVSTAAGINASGGTYIFLAIA